MATDYGRDLYCTTDLDASLTEVSGAQMMAQVCLRRLYTPRGSLLSSPSENTIDVRGYLSETVDLTRQDLVGIKAACTAALLADPRIESVTVTPRFDSVTRVLTLGIDANGALGPFSLTLAVTSLTVELLNG